MKRDSSMGKGSQSKKNSLIKIILTLLFSFGICIIFDLIFALIGLSCPVWLFFICLSVVSLILWNVNLCSRAFFTWFGFISLAIIGGGIGVFLCWKSFSQNAVYLDVDHGKSDLFSDKNVMVVVPHEDDDTNLFGGVFEEYLKYGSTVRVVFVSTGDCYYSGEERMREALRVMDYIGIPEENIFFLGFGDSWQSRSSIYYGEPNEVVISQHGCTETYALPEHPAYRDGLPYTRDNLIDTLISVISEYKPDTIFCSDMDEHIDHRMVSLLFEEALGRLLKTSTDYSPVVYKGYTYPTAHYARDDFYAENLHSTRQPYNSEYLSDTNLFRWNDRIRFPVNPACLSRSMYSSRLYHEAELYFSQYYRQIAGRFINGDRVFWQRETSSLLYHADFSASSGETSKLNDFCLLASDDESKKLQAPFTGAWIPDINDEEKTISVQLKVPCNLASVVLYDSYSLEDNILDAEIRFPSGNIYHTGPLVPGGTGTYVTVDEKNVMSFSLRILDSEGNHAGLSEIEAYSSVPHISNSFIKLMNTEDDFLYDYRFVNGTSELFSLYTYGCSSNLDDYTIHCSNTNISALVVENRILISCPRGESGVITVYSSSDPELSDSIFISHFSPTEKAGWQIERFFHNNAWRYYELQESAIYSILRWCYHLFFSEHITINGLPG